DQPVDRFDPRGSAAPNMNTKRFAERRLFMSACNHFLTLLTVVVICRQPSSLNFPRSWAELDILITIAGLIPEGIRSSFIGDRADSTRLAARRRDRACFLAFAMLVCRRHTLNI